ATAFLGKIRRREIDGDPAGREFEVAVDQSTAHPVLAFLHCRFRQADDGHARQAIGQMDLHRYQRCADAALGASVDNGERHEWPTFPCRLLLYSTWAAASFP